MSDLILTDQHERFVLAGYAAFVDESVIYQEFRAAFPEAINIFSEELGETKLPTLLKDSISHLSPAHPKFDKERLGLLFDALRREYLNGEDSAFMGQSRNRLEVMNDVRLKLMAHAEENPDELTDCMKLIINATREARAEKMAFMKASDTARFSISPEELASLLGKLPPHKQEQFAQSYESGEEHPELFIQRLQREVEAYEQENENGKNSTEQGQEVLPNPESIGHESAGDGRSFDELEVQRITNGDIQSPNGDRETGEADTVQLT